MNDMYQKSDSCWSRLPVYRSGGKLTAEQLTAEQVDSDKRERMLNLALHGWGVVHGLDIATDDGGKIAVKNGCIHMGCGLAIDPRGRTLYWDGGPVGMDDVVGDLPHKEGCYTLSAHYAERNDPGSWDPCHDGSRWVHRCVVFTLRPHCTPHDPCPQCQPENTCISRRDYICARTGQVDAKRFQDPELELACGDPPPLNSSACGRFSYDPTAGIPLACVDICNLTVDDNCPKDFGFCPCPPMDDDRKDDEKYKESAKLDLREEAAARAAELEAAALPENERDGASHQHPGKPGGPGGSDKECGCDTTSCDIRPVAYRSPLLYELINDADVDLAKVAGYSWARYALGDWPTRMPVDVFESMVLACIGLPNGDCDVDQARRAGFIIRFTKAVDPRTLHPLSVLLELYVPESDFVRELNDEVVFNWKHHRVPVVIKPILDRRDRSCALGVQICPKAGWWEHAERWIKKCASEGQLARVEITLRGQTIRDKCGCMFDALPPELTCRDHCGKKTGQARPGQDWVSTFRIGDDFDCECDDGYTGEEKPEKEPVENPEVKPDEKGDAPSQAIQQSAPQQEVSNFSSSRNGDTT